MRFRIVRLYKLLRSKYGHPRGQWRLWCKRPKTTAEKEQVIIEAILTQRTNWRNVELAIAAMKKQRIVSLQGLLRSYRKRPHALHPLIRPTGFYQNKARSILSLAAYVIQHGGMRSLKQKNVHGLREELLALPGVGPETADSIVLYALHKPSFVIDEYTRRLVERERISKNLSYDSLKKLFENSMRKDYRLYQDFHALIVIDGKKRT